MAGRGHLDREKLYELFETLDKELRHERGDRTVIYVAGGARMALGLHDGRTTNDIDCVIRENHGAASKAVRKITERAKLPNDWLNEELGQVMPKSPDTGEVTLFSGSKLVVKGASAKRMLGMKICAHRKIDIDDAKVLVKRLNLKSTKEYRRSQRTCTRSIDRNRSRTLRRDSSLLRTKCLNSRSTTEENRLRPHQPGSSQGVQQQARIRENKKMAGYHRFHAVETAVAGTLRAATLLRQPARVREERGRYELGEPARRGGGRPAHRRRLAHAGVKSLTMAFYAGRIVREPAMRNPTVVVLTDRNDLDDQLFTTFSRCADLLRQPPSRPRAGPTCGRSSRWSPAAWCSRSSSRRRRATAAPHAEALRIRDVGFDWILRGNVRVHLRRLVKRILRKHGHPPDKQEAATRTVLEQAEVLSAVGAA